jgi:hypothetical protein
MDKYTNELKIIFVQMEFFLKMGMVLGPKREGGNPEEF